MFKDLLAGIKGFKYEVTLKVLLSKYKENAEREFASVYFNSTTKILTGYEENFGRSFQEIFDRIDNWIREATGWVTESTDGEYVNVFIYSPLSGRSYIELPYKLRSSKKGLIKIKNDDNKCFFWCHVRNLDPLETHPERITKVDKKWLVVLITAILNFLSPKIITVKQK